MFKNFLFALLTAIVLLFVVQNTQVVEIKFFIWQTSMSRALILLATFLIGIIGGWLSKSTKKKEED